jgi:hydroquinone glucosyltransferase
MESSTSTVAAPPTRTGKQAVPPRPHVVLVASPGAGHLIPMVELARRLVSHHGLAATLVTFTDLSTPDAHSAVFASLRDADVATAALPAVPLDDLPVDAAITSVVLAVIGRSVPHLRALLRDVASSKPPLAALVPDFFCSAALPLAVELGVPGYLFFPSNLSLLAVVRGAVELNDGGEYRGLPDPFPLPGRVSLRREDLPDGLRDSSLPVYAHLVEEGRRYRAAKGFLVNTFYEMEPANVEELKNVAGFPPAYPVGPLIRSSPGSSDESACIDWLDRQPTGSVVYVSFGSSGALSVEQTAELAAGLEDCGHRFLWVVHAPSLDGDHCSLGKSSGNDDPLAWLPDGFLDRTRDRGLAVSSWAPQVRVLSHPATAAFVSHCGWNSTLESMVAGVPMVAWPLHAEQRMNAAVLSSESVGVALRPRAREGDGAVVPREEIVSAVRELMEGKEKGRAVRRRAGHLQQAAAKAWGAEGSSCRTLEEVAAGLKAAALGRCAPCQATRDGGMVCVDRH